MTDHTTPCTLPVDSAGSAKASVHAIMCSCLSHWSKPIAWGTCSARQWAGKSYIMEPEVLVAAWRQEQLIFLPTHISLH